MDVCGPLTRILISRVSFHDQQLLWRVAVDHVPLVIAVVPFSRLHGRRFSGYDPPHSRHVAF